MVGSDTPNTIDASEYYQHVMTNKEAGKLFDSTPRIAVIQASGQITEGEQPSGIVGSETLVSLIRSARDNENTAAIVLRIDSPGGSAFASELIREELAAAQAEGKPVVASMGGVAASGGYWIAASTNEIWATPTTITGSIGVFGMIPTLEESLKKIGVYSDGYSTTQLADAAQPDRPMNPLAARVLQQGVDFTYREFLRLVADGRKRSPEAIDKIAQGRVWTGTHAQQLGLVDHLGDLDDAIAAAAGLANVKNYEPDFLEPELSPWESLLQTFSSEARFPQALLPHEWTQWVQWLKALPVLHTLENLPRFNDPNHIYVHCWECKAASLR